MSRKSNVATVIVITGNDQPLEVVAQEGIVVDQQEGVFGFCMKTKSPGKIRWNDRHKQGLVLGDRLIRAGFYLRKRNDWKGKHVDPCWYNIGSPYPNGWEDDMEILLQSPGSDVTWDILSCFGEYHGIELVNFPKDQRLADGEWMIRLPDGHFLRFTSPHGNVCILNVNGHLTMHHGRIPNPNTHAKAVRAFNNRAEYLKFSPQQLDVMWGEVERSGADSESSQPAVAA